jgi:cytochrome c biogenesis protein CcdA
VSAVATAHGFGGIAMTALFAIVLGLRHAADPDHLTAISTLMMSESCDGPRRASKLGLAWGIGHATTLFLFGLPVVLIHVPPRVQQGAEVAIGVLIVVLAVRLLVSWTRRGARGLAHAHPHGAHSHHHPAPGRSLLASFGIGLVHGVGGSAGASVLLVTALPDPAEGAIMLLLFAAGTAVSMSIASGLFGWGLGRVPGARGWHALVPVFGVFSLLFGGWYALSALGVWS